MNRSFLPIVASAACLSACASFDGAPKPVITVAQADQMVALYPPDTVIGQLATYQTDGERTTYRNRVVSSYLMAADAKYDEFRRDISKSIKGGNVAFDLATLGLTGVASVWAKAADELAAAATVMAGSRASLNKELYFERTLPILLSLMDSSRLKVRSDILKGLSEPESTYTMQDAFSDIWRYQAAASIDGAIQQAAGAAADEAKQVKLDYSKAVALCEVSAELGKGRKDIMRGIEKEKNQAATATDAAAAAAHRATIQKVAIAAGMTDAKVAADKDATEAQVNSISDYVLTICSPETLATFRGAVIQAGVKLP
jgi:hypothetical protein